MKKITVALLLALVICIFCAPIKAYASNGIMISDELDGLEGDGKYVGSEYRNNYQLDVEKLGVTEVAEKALNALANIVFSVISFLGFATVAIFYHALSFDLAALLQPQIDSIQLALHDSVFTPLLQVALMGAIVLAITKYARRDFSGLLGQLGKVIFIMVLSLMIVRDSATLLSYATSVTKSVSVSILTGISGTNVESNVNDYSASSAGVLWVSLVHEPWKSLEFGDYHYTSEDVEFFLSTSSEKSRADRVKEMMDGDSGPFAKGRSSTRIGQGLIILITMFIKCVVYMMVAIMYIVFQLIAVFFTMMAPLILLLALIPGYDFEILGIWVRKIIETQIGVLIITFLMGVMIMIDGLLHDLANEMGWFVVLILQIGASLGLYAFRWQLFSAFNSAQRSVQSPRLMKRELERSGNPYSGFEKLYMYKQVQHAMGYRQQKKPPAREYTTQGMSGRQIEGQGWQWQYDPLSEPGNRRSGQGWQPDPMEGQEPQNGWRGGQGWQPDPKGGQSRQDNQYDRQRHGQDRQRRSGSPGGAQNRQNNQVDGHNPQLIEDSGIKGESYHASRAVTDNWHDIWNSAEPVYRPRTTDKSRKSNRRPILTEAEKGLQRPQMAHTAPESGQAEPKSRREEKGLKKENYVEDEVVRPVTTPTPQRNPADAAPAVRAAQQQVKKRRPEPISSSEIGVEEKTEQPRRDTNTAALERPTTAEHIKKHETITAAQEFGSSEMGNSKNNEISQPRPVMKPGSAEVDKSSTVNYIYQENEIPADRPHSQDNQEKIKRPNIGQVAPEPELKQPGQPSGRLQKETQVKRPSIQNYSGNKEGSAMKTGMRGRHTEKTPLKASRIHSDGFKIKK